jgi:flagellar motility protein MotE (MotC chaperone)
MTGYLRDLRLIPIAVVASACLLVLIAADLLLGGGIPAAFNDAPMREADATVTHSASGGSRLGDAQRPAPPRSGTERSGAERSWAQEMFNFPDSKSAPPERADRTTGLTRLPAVPPLLADKNNADIITGSVPEKDDKSEKAKGEAAAAPGNAVKDPPPAPDGIVIPNNGAPGPSAAERAILEHLQERRQELDKRGRELDIREGLIAEAEKRMDGKLGEIKEAQAQLVTAAQKKDEAEAARFKGLVTMYENMKPRDAAKIFDRLEVGVLLQVASQINPRNMSEILAQMSPDAAERLTVELANRAQGAPKGANADLPKIEGRPTQQ